MIGWIWYQGEEDDDTCEQKDSENIEFQQEISKSWMQQQINKWRYK